MTSTQQDRKERYEAKRIIKKVSFNNETDTELLNKIEELQIKYKLTFSELVKKLIQDA